MGLTAGPSAPRDPGGVLDCSRAWLNVKRGDASGDWKQATPQGRRQMKERYKFIMKELDIGCGRFIEGHKGDLQFMDVCCCPGGFSEYILLAAPKARGLGLSLDTQLGGHIPSFETVDPLNGHSLPCPLLDASRYHLRYIDITTAANKIVCDKISPTTPEGALHLVVSAGAHGTGNQCHLMILDGSFLGGKSHIYMEVPFNNDLQNPAFNCYSSYVAANQALLAAQLAIMAWNAADGATVVLRMSMTWSHFTNSVLALLRRLFTGEIQNYKPRSCHQTAISYYLVCKGFNLTAAKKLQVGHRFAGLVKRLRARAPAVNLIPFNDLPEGRGDDQLYAMWGLALHVFHLPLWLFRKLCEDAEKQPAVLGAEYKRRPCWKHLVFRDSWSGCRSHGSCKEGAHGDADLHPCVSVAFRQVNGQLYMPNPDGTLLPGHGHARNEEVAVMFKVLSWGEEQLRRHKVKVLNDMQMNGMQLPEPPDLKFYLLRDILYTPIAQEVWARMINIAADEEVRLFQNITATGVMRLGPGGFTLQGKAHMQAKMLGHTSFAAERVLRGPVPGAPYSGSAMPPERAFTGTKLTWSQPAPLTAPGGAVSALGKRPAAGQLHRPPRGAMMNGAIDMGDAYLEGGWMEEEEDGSSRGDSGAGLDPQAAAAAGEDQEEEEEAVTELPEGARLSGYHTLFGVVSTAQDGFSQVALLDYLS